MLPKRKLPFSNNATYAQVSLHRTILLEVPHAIRQFSIRGILQVIEGRRTLQKHLSFRSRTLSLHLKIHRILQQRATAQNPELPYASEEGGDVLLQTSDANDLTYRELGGPKESAFTGFLQIFAGSDFVRKLTHFRKRLQNKEKTDPSRIDGFRFHYPFISPLLFSCKATALCMKC